MSAVLDDSKQSVKVASRIGPPLGNRNSAKGREWFTAVKYALAKYDKNSIKRGRALREIALKLVEDALAGKEYAIREISERLDGKVSSGEGSGSVRVLVIRGDSPTPIDVTPIHQLDHDDKSVL